MFEQIMNYIGTTALKHVAVKQYKYQKRIMINQQDNNAYMQVVIEDDPYGQYIKESGVYTLTINIDVLGFPKDDTEILKIQSDAFQVASELIAYIDKDTTFMDRISVYDYSMLSISHFTDDNAAGQRLSLELVVPNPINLCTLDDNFSENISYVEKDELELKDPNPESKANELVLKPIKLSTWKQKG